MEKLGVTYGLQDPTLDQQPAAAAAALEEDAHQDDNHPSAAALSSPRLEDKSDNLA